MARRGPQPWNAERWLDEYAKAKGRKDWDGVKTMLTKVADHNYRCKEFWTVPRTIPVTFQECSSARLRPDRGETQISISTKTTAEACQHFARARDSKNVVCALNFANGQTAGGGYKSGATAQEEDLCRQCPTLYSSLYAAVKDKLYPFGPCTCSVASQPEKYSDVLYTSGLVIARGGAEEGYPLLPEDQEVTVSMVAAAAPNIRFANEISDSELIYRTVQTIFKAPKMHEPEVNTLILGAWGCGAFGGEPAQIADLFVRAIVSDNLGQYYKHIHFAMPLLSPTDNNYEVFREVLKQYRLSFTDLDNPGSR